MIRVALRVEPAVLHNLVLGMLSAEPEVQVVEGSPAVARADVIVLSEADPENFGTPTSLLMRSPHSRVLVLSENGRRCFFYTLRVHRTELGEPSRASLLAALHSVEEETR